MFVSELRVKHYIKNALVFIPVIFNGELFNRVLFHNTLFGGFAFCTVSSIIYAINDLCDYNNDRLNMLKQKRPLASGKITKKEVNRIIGGLSIFFIIFTLQIHLTIPNKPYNCIWDNIVFIRYIIPFLYLAINIAYSIGLKNIPIIDISIIASGFILRVFYGGIITGITISPWVYLTITSGSIYLSLGKRLGELRCETAGKRKCLLNSPVISGYHNKSYTSNFLDQNMYMCLSLSLVFYALSCMDMNTKVRIMGRNLLWTVPLVLLICLRYNLNLETTMDGDPINIIIKDKILLGLITILSFGIIITIYF